MLATLRSDLVSLAGGVLLCAAMALACGKDGCKRGEDATPPAPPSVPNQGTEGQPFRGRVVDVLTFEGPQILEPLERRAAELRARTGVEVRVTGVPFRKLYQTMLDDLRSQSQRYQVYVFASQWLPDFAAPGFLENLDPRIAADKALAWDDIASFFREFGATYDGNPYAIPLDGDFQMVYYRTDLLAAAGLEPPRTWDDYLVIASTFHGRDLDGDEVPDYGSCIAKRPASQAYSTLWSIAGPYLQSQGTREGAFFDADTMAPLTSNAAFARALEIYRDTGKYGPPDERALDHAAARQLYISGRCALTVDWGDIGTLTFAPDSKVQDLVGSVIAPGARAVLDRKTGKLVPCTKLTCPYAVAGVNHAPYAATGGWAGAIGSAAPADVKDAAFAFLSYVSQPAQSGRDVTIGTTGFNPYRMVHFRDRNPWIAAGMSAEAAARYLGAIGLSLSSPNMVLDLRIPHAQRYQQEVLDAALDAFLTGKRTLAETMQDVTEGWNRITDELGRDAQRHAYRASLGLPR
jgi:multiple sugar transport system substrate-binding protein